MEDILKEWLGSTVERELRLALELWERTSSFSSGTDKYDDDGTTLRIKLSKGHPVQISKLVNLHGPITVLVSDSMTDINASITTAAAQHFLTTSRRRLDEGTLGDIIHLQNFDIMATYMGPDKCCRITLSIKTFDFLGSEASPIFGRPRVIQDSIAIQSLERRLRALWTANFAQLEPAIEDKPASNSIPQSEIDRFELSSDDGEENSQQALATQAPSHASKTNSKIHRPSALQDGKTFSPAQLKYLPGVKEGQPTDKGNARSALCHPFSGNSSLMTSRPTGNEVRKHSEALLRLLPSDLARAKRTIQSVESPKSSISSKSGDIERQETRAKLAINVGDSDESLFVARGSVHLVKEASLPSQPEPSIGAVAEDKNSPLRAKEESPGQTRLEIPRPISSREVIIPKNQQHLLEQPDSWLPVEPGRRYPFANVPIKTLQEISDSADRWAVRLSKQTEKVKSPPSEQSEQGQLSEPVKESDEECVSDWSTSSLEGRNDIRQLPPDSSPELPINAVKFSHKKPQDRLSSLSPRPRNSVVVSKTRKSVSTSPLHSLQSSSRRSVRPVDSPNLYPKPTPPFKKHHTLTDLTRTGEVTETDYSQGTEGDQTRKEKGIPESSRTGDGMKNKDSILNRDPAVNEQVNIVNSKNTDAAQSSVDSHEISATEMESLGREPQSHISNSNSGKEKRHSHVDNTSIESGSSTASQREEPGLQVKRTPYCNGQVPHVDSQILESCQSPSKSRSLPLVNDIRIKCHTHTLSTQPDIINASSIDSQRTILSEDLAVCSDGAAARHRQLQNQDVSNMELAIYSDGEENDHDIPDEDLIAWQLQHEIASQSQSGASRSTCVEETHLVVEETVFQRTAVVHAGTPVTTTDEDGKGMKRKLLENEMLSPNITKRRRNIRDLSKPGRKLEDISAIGRALEFLSKGASVSPLNQEDAMQLSAEDRTSFFGRSKNEKTASHDAESPTVQSNPGKLSTNSRSSTPNAQVRQASEDEQGLRDKRWTSIDDPVDELMIDVDDQENKAERLPNKVDSVSGGSVQPPRNITMFDRFKLSYPEYSGNMDHFTAICSKLQKRIDAGRGLHQALWDDFIIRQKIEYANYLQDCVNKAEDPMPYDKFYENEIHGARFINQVITRKTLDEALASLLTNENEVKDGGGNSNLSRLNKSRHSSRTSHLGSIYASPQIIDLSEKPSEKFSRRSLPGKSPNARRSTLRPKPVTPSTPRPSFLSRTRSNQTSSSSHLSRKKPETEWNSPAPLSTVNTPSMNRGEAAVLETQPDRASEVSPAVNADYRRVNVDRTFENAFLRDGPRSRTKRDTDRAYSNAPLLVAPHSKMGRDISRATSNAPPPDAPRSRVIRDVSQTSSDAPLIGADYRRIKRDSDRTSRESPSRGTSYRNISKDLDHKPKPALLDRAHPRVKMDPDPASNGTPPPDAGPHRTKRDSDRATEDTPPGISDRRRVKRDTIHPPTALLLNVDPLRAKRYPKQLSKPPHSPHRSAKPTDPKPSTDTTLSEHTKTKTVDDVETSNPLIKFAREYLAIEAGRGNSFAALKRSDDVEERPKLRKLDVANWHL